MSRAAHLKKPRRGFFARRTIRRADAVRIHPPGEFSLVAKQKTSVISTLVLLVGAGGFEPPKLKAADLQSVPIGHSGTRPYSLFVSFAGRLVYSIMQKGFCQLFFYLFLQIENSITNFNKFLFDFLCILAQHKQAVKFPFLAARFICSVLPTLSSHHAFPAMRSLSYIMVAPLFVTLLAPVPVDIGGTLSPRSYTRESSGGSC